MPNSQGGNHSNNKNRQSDSKKRKHMHSQNNNHHRKRKPEDLTSKIARILGANNQESSLTSSSSSSTGNNHHSSHQKQVPSCSTTSSTLPGFYFDNKANRYFPIPKNGLECSLLVGSSEERKSELESHKMNQQLKSLNSKKKICSIQPPTRKGIQLSSTIIKHQASTLLNNERTNQFYTLIKSRIIHPSDKRLYNKHIVNRMENFKFLDSISNIGNWKENEEILKFEEIESNIQILNYENVKRNQERITKNIMISTQNNQIHIGQVDFKKNENFHHIDSIDFDGKPTYSIMKKTLKNNRQSSNLHYYLIVTPKQTSNLWIVKLNLENEIDPISHRTFNISKNKTVFSHSIHPNNSWCALGLNKGGLIIDLNFLIAKHSNTIKASTIAFMSNQYSDILLTYWNPFIKDFGELFYARRDGGLYISQLKQRSNNDNSTKPTYSQKEIACLQYGPESFIGQILSLDEDRFLVRSVCKNGLSFSTYIHMFDKRKLVQNNHPSNNSPFQSYQVCYEYEQQSIKSNSLTTIMEEVNNMKMFIHDSRFLICGGVDGRLRVWSVLCGGKPISIQKLHCTEMGYYSSEGYLIMSLASVVGGHNAALGVPLH